MSSIADKFSVQAGVVDYDDYGIKGNEKKLK
jgi:hypothetical protein